MFGDVIVPLDGSSRSARVLEPAAKVASAMNSRLRVVTFIDDWVEPSVREHLEAQVLEVRPGGNFDYDITVEPVGNSVRESLRDWVDDKPGALVCMATHGRGRSAALFGSVATDLLRHRSGPLLLIGPGYEPGRFEVDAAMLVTLDGSAHGEHILPIAESWAIVFHNSVEIVQVIPIAPPGSADRTAVESAYVQRIAGSASATMGPDVNADVLHNNDPAKAILGRVSDHGIGVVAMTTHGETGTARALTGSVAADVIRHSPCPVLAIRPAALR